MAQLLAALDDSAATGPVVAVSQWYAALADLEVVALHVSEDGSGHAAHAAADAAGVKFELRQGEPIATLCAAAEDADVQVVVVGARGVPTQRMPAGHVALDVIRTVEKPVIVVPPDARVPSNTRLRLLAPIDEDVDSANALRRLLEDMSFPDLDLVLLRVFDANHMPKFANHGTYEAEHWAVCLAQSTVPAEAARSRVEMRVGHPAHAILDVERELAADLVVLAWGRKLLGGRASVVRRLLSHATTPLVLLPVKPCGASSAQPHADRRTGS